MMKFRLTEKQKELISKLESATRCVTVLNFAPHALCLSLEDQEGHSLYYRSAKTLEEIIASGEHQQYPDLIQRGLMCIWQSRNVRKKKHCNMLPSSVYGDTLDTILANALCQAELLKCGWHLSFDEDFCNPFVRCRKTKKEHIQ